VLTVVKPVTLAERSKAWAVFARADAGTVGSNLTLGMDVDCLCCVCIFLCFCTVRGIATGWSPVQGVLSTVLDLVTGVKRKVSWRRPRSELGYRAKGKKTVVKLFISFWISQYRMVTHFQHTTIAQLFNMYTIPIFLNGCHVDDCVNIGSISSRLQNCLVLYASFCKINKKKTFFCDIGLTWSYSIEFHCNFRRFTRKKSPHKLRYDKKLQTQSSDSQTRTVIKI
jgi:hypothetical protein